jgi:hypothetical protein
MDPILQVIIVVVAIITLLLAFGTFILKLIDTINKDKGKSL